MLLRQFSADEDRAYKGSKIKGDQFLVIVTWLSPA